MAVVLSCFSTVAKRRTSVNDPPISKPISVQISKVFELRTMAALKMQEENTQARAITSQKERKVQNMMYIKSRFSSHIGNIHSVWPVLHVDAIETTRVTVASKDFPLSIGQNQ